MSKRYIGKRNLKTDRPEFTSKTSFIPEHVRLAAVKEQDKVLQGKGMVHTRKKL